MIDTTKVIAHAHLLQHYLTYLTITGWDIVGGRIKSIEESPELDNSLKILCEFFWEPIRPLTLTLDGLVVNHQYCCGQTTYRKESESEKDIAIHLVSLEVKLIP